MSYHEAPRHIKCQAYLEREKKTPLGAKTTYFPLHFFGSPCGTSPAHQCIAVFYTSKLVFCMTVLCCSTAHARVHREVLAQVCTDLSMRDGLVGASMAVQR